MTVTRFEPLTAAHFDQPITILSHIFLSGEH